MPAPLAVALGPEPDPAQHFDTELAILRPQPDRKDRHPMNHTEDFSPVGRTVVDVRSGCPPPGETPGYGDYLHVWFSDGTCWQL